MDTECLSDARRIIGLNPRPQLNPQAMENLKRNDLGVRVDQDRMPATALRMRWTKGQRNPFAR